MSQRRRAPGRTIAGAGAITGRLVRIAFARNSFPRARSRDRGDFTGASPNSHSDAHLDSPAVFSSEPAPGAPHPGQPEEGLGDLATLLVFAAFLLAVGASIGFVVVYWTTASHMLLGGLAALAMGSFGSGLVLWSHWFMEKEQVIDTREILVSPPPEQEAVTADLLAQDQVQRRKLLVGFVTGTLAAFAAAIISLFRSFAKPPFPALKPTIWRPGDRLVTLEGRPVNINTLAIGSTISVFPENRIDAENAQVVLVRVYEGLLRLPPSRADWAPSGYLAYSRVCTHAGCSVGLYERELCLLECPCHQSTFDVLSGAQPTGGPADRELPQLPLYADADGNLRARGDFTAPPGPGFWGLP
jgi:ubiquinol-cytochrome c reductase iron-sulfur subunit